VYYIISHLTHYKLRVYYLVIRICSEVRKHPIRTYIRVSSAPHSYLIISIFAFVYVLKIWKRIWEGPYPIRIHPFTVIWSLWLYRNNKMNNKVLSLVGPLQMYRYALFVVTSLKSGESRSIYGGLYTIKRYYERYYFST
jgi:hypothetical protein